MVPRGQKRANLHEKLQQLRSVTNSHAVISLDIYLELNFAICYDFIPTHVQVYTYNQILCRITYLMYLSSLLEFLPFAIWFLVANDLRQTC